MPISTFFGLNIGVSALEAMNQANSVVANNIANQNTQGYVQESTDMVEANPVDTQGPYGQTAQGVSVAAISRQTNDFIDQQDRLNQGTYQMYSTHAQGLTQLQSIIHEPSSNSVQNALDQFFASWQTLSANPSNTAARQSVIAQATALGQTFAMVTQQIEQMQTGVQSAADTQITQINNYAAQVDQLNQQIVQQKANGQTTNTLLDQRDSVLDKMSQMANISYAPSPNGAISVTLGQLNLVSDQGGTPDQVMDFSQITSGSMAGNNATLTDITNVLSQLNDFLGSFAGAVNNVQMMGYGLDSTSSGSSVPAPPLLDVNSDNQGNVTLSLHVTGADASGNPTYVTASDVAASAFPNRAGDNTNALAMVSLQTQTGTYNSGTFDEGLSKMVADLGVEAQSVNSSETTSNSLSQQSASLRQSIEGVDVNQQEALMVQYQNSYGAAAKFISAVDEMLKTLINMVPN